MKHHLPCKFWAGTLAAYLCALSSVSADLIHRYSFTTDANDSVGTAHGQAVNTAAGSPPAFAGGQVTLDGIGGYIDLPNGIVSKWTNITIEAWVTVNNNGNWARVFDFGTSTPGEVAPSAAIGTGIDYMFLTPNAGGSGNARFAITDTDQAATGGERPVLNDPDDFPLAEQVHVAVVYGPPVARLYVNGRLAASGTAVIPLRDVADVNVWLGRSQWADSFYDGSYNEFRIHNALIGGPEIKASSLGAPEALSYDPGTVSSVSITGETAMSVGGAQTPVVNATFSISGQITLASGEFTITSSAPSVVEVTSTGALSAKGVGSATITASRGGQSGTMTIAVAPANPAVLKHRYSFAGASTSTVITDSVGSQHGEIRPPFATAAVANPAPVVQTNGQAVFPSGVTWDSAGYINLPDGLISSKTNVTIETWVTWNGPNNNASQNWARIFDFGESSKGDDAQFPGNGTGFSGFFLTPRANAGTLRFDTLPAGGPDIVLDTPTIAINTQAHIVVVYAPGLGTSRLYVNGALRVSGAANHALNRINDVNNWLGASQWQGDQPYFGSINEFRIYEGVLTDIEIALDRTAGPDTLPPAPGPIQSLASAPVDLFQGNPATTTAVITANFQNAANVNITTVAGVVYTASDTNIFTVSTAGALLARNVGAATLTATFQGLTATSTVSVLAPTAVRVDLANTALTAGAPTVVATLRADFTATSTNVNVSGYTGVTRASSNTNVVTVAANGTLTAKTAGSADITSTYGGKTVVTPVTSAFPAGYLPGTLRHRYSFNGARGTTAVTDSVGTAHGEFVGSDGGTNEFTGTGQLSMGGSAWNAAILGGYVNLPNRLVSTLGSVTLEGWLTYRGGGANQRFFDIGMSSGLESAPGIFDEDVVLNPGRSYMFLSAATNPRFAIKEGTGAETPNGNFTSASLLTVGSSAHYALVYDQPNGVVRLYVNGVRGNTGAATLPLSVVDDRNVWLGRSVWQDPMYNGTFDEFRIYNGPLSDADIAASFAAGPNTPITPGANEPVISTPLRITSAVQNGGNFVMTWTGGEGPFLVQRDNGGLGSAWVDVVTTIERTTTQPMVASASFYRIVEKSTKSVLQFKAVLSGAAERPTPVTTPASGSASVSLDGNTLTYLVTYTGLTGNITNGHIHGPAGVEAAAGVMIGFFGFPQANPGREGTLTGTLTLTDAQRTNITTGQTYVNIHSSTFGGGEIRGQLVPAGN